MLKDWRVHLAFSSGSLKVSGLVHAQLCVSYVCHELVTCNHRYKLPEVIAVWTGRLQVDIRNLLLRLNKILCKLSVRWAVRFIALITICSASREARKGSTGFLLKPFTKSLQRVFRNKYETQAKHTSIDWRKIGNQIRHVVYCLTSALDPLLEIVVKR
jgi:hypothetical protein